MDAYTLSIIGHIVGTIAMMFGLVLVLVSLIGMRSATGVPQVRRWAGIATKVDKLIPVGAVLILASGLYLVIAAWNWRQGWINVSLVTLLLVTPLVPTLIAFRLAAVAHQARSASGNTIPAGLRATMLDPLMWTGVLIVTAMSFGILYLMIFKPTDIATSVVAMGMALIIGLVVSLPAWRWRRELT